MKQIKSVKIAPEPPNSKYKHKARFTLGADLTKTTKFRARGYKDYTIHKDPPKKENYISCHKKDLLTNDPTRAGYLAMFLLWNKPTLTDSIKDYKSRIKIYNQTGKFPIN